MVALLTEGSTTLASTLADLLSSATKVVTWMITSMGSYLSFITGNPVVLILFLMLIAGSAIGFLFRIWHSA